MTVDETRKIEHFLPVLISFLLIVHKINCIARSGLSITRFVWPRQGRKIE